MDQNDVVDVIERTILENARIQNSFVSINVDFIEKTMWISRSAIESVNLTVYKDKKDNLHYRVELQTKSSRLYKQTYSASEIPFAKDKAEALLDHILGLNAEASLY